MFVDLQTPVVNSHLFCVAMDAEEKTSYGYSALHTAVISRDLKAVRALTTTTTGSERCDLDSKDAMGFTALHLATLQGNKELVEMLVLAGSDINSRTKVSTLVSETGFSFKQMLLPFPLTLRN